MALIEKCAEILARVKATKPLIHQITNAVTINDCANVTLAIGASPVMTSDPNEVEEMVAHAGALVLNVGTLNSQTVESMLRAGARAAKLNIPIVLDPVGVGATALRTEAVRRIMAAMPLTVIRGNMSEIKIIANSAEGIRGVDSTASAEGGEEIARELSKLSGAVVAITGAVDIVSDGERVCRIHNGHPMLRSVTGTGCMATALIGSCAATGARLEAAVTGLAVMGLAGEIAYRNLRPNEGDGLGMFRVRLIDAISNITEKDVELCKIQLEN